MQKLNYNYRSDVTNIATLDLFLGAFQWRVTLHLSKFLILYLLHTCLRPEICFITTEKDNNLILMFTLKRFKNVFIQRLKYTRLFVNISVFILPQRSTCIFTKKALTV